MPAGEVGTGNSNSGNPGSTPNSNDVYVWLEVPRKHSLNNNLVRSKPQLLFRQEVSSAVGGDPVVNTRLLFLPVSNLVVNLRQGLVSSLIFDSVGCGGCVAEECLLSINKLNITSSTSPNNELEANVPNIGDSTSDIVTLDSDEIKLRPSSASCFKTISSDEQASFSSQTQTSSVFVTFAGSDADDTPAKSSGLRMSQFAGSTLSDMWRNAKDQYRVNVR